MSSHHRSAPSVTRLLAGLCTVVSVLTLVPRLRAEFGKDATDPVVRMLTAPFVHGFSPASTIPHLAGNLVLLLSAGSAVERALGSRRFALLTGAALLGYVAVQLIGHFGVNGASVFIWAYAPALAVRYASGDRSTRTEATVAVLVVMWIIVPVLMTAVPYTFGWSGSVLGAFLVANTFHLSATAVGGAAALVWRARLLAHSKAWFNQLEESP